MADEDPKTQFVQLPFMGGIDEKTAIEYVDPSKRQAAIVNGMFTHVGAVNKRYGVKQLAATMLPGNAVTSPLTTGRRLASTSRSGILAFGQGADGKTALYNYAADAPVPGFAGIGRIPAVRAQRRQIVTTPGAVAPKFADALVGSLRLVVTQSADFLKMIVSAYDTETGAVILQPQTIALVTGGGFPGPVQVFALTPAEIAIVYQSNAQTWVRFYSVGANTIGAAVHLLNGGGYVDACPFIGDPAHGFIVVQSAGTTITWAYFNAAGALVTSGTVAAGIAFVPRLYVYATFGAAEFIWISYGSHVGASFLYKVDTLLGDGSFTHNATATIFGSSVQLDTTPIVRVDAGHAWWGAIDIAAPATSLIAANYGTWSIFNPAGAATVSKGWPLGLTPWGRPLVDNGDVIIPCGLFMLRSIDNAAFDTVTEQPTLYLVRFSSAFPDGGLPVATVAPRTLNQNSIGAATLLGLFPMPFMSCGPKNDTLPASGAIGGGILSTDHIAETDNQGAQFAADFFFDQSLSYEVDELGDGAHIAAAVPMTFDGSSVFENSFFYYPEFTYLTITNPSSGALNGNFGFAVVYRYTDAAGNEAKSAPYFTPIVTIATGHQATVTVPRLSMSYRHNVGGSPVYADIYRTLTNGSTYYLLSTIDVTPPANPVAFGSPAGWFASFGPDATPDIDLNVASFLYTTGGVLDAVNPPSFSCQCVHKNRLWGVDETGQTIWFSQKFQTSAAIGFNEANTFSVNEGGDVTALAELDDKLVIFKAASIYIVFGDGPALTGLGSDLTEPQKLASDVGAVDWRSVVLTPNGLLFRARSGIHLLGRDLSVKYIGKAVQDTLGNAAIVSAELVASAQHVRFLLEGGQTAIVYDYFLDQWTVFEYAQAGSDVIGSCVDESGLYTLLTANGLLFQERGPDDTTRWLDDDAAFVSNFVPTSIAIPSVKLQGVQGFQRARVVQFKGDPGDSHGISLNIAVNDDPTAVQTASWTSVQLAANPYGDQAALYVAGAFSMVESMAVTIADTAGAAVTTGEGAVFVTLGLEIQSLGKRFRPVPIAARQ